MVSTCRKKLGKLPFLIPILLLWILVSLFVYYQYSIEKDHKSKELNTQLQLLNHFILTDLSEGKSIEDAIKESALYSKDVRITLLSINGDVLFDNVGDKASMDNHLGRYEVDMALREGSGHIICRLSQTNNIRYFYSATRGDKYIVRSAMPYSISLHNMLKANSMIWWLVVVLTIVITIVVIILFYIVKQSNSNYVRFLEQEQEKIRIKRQLTNNINHELKTPVASIQVCLETLVNNPNMSKDMQSRMIDRCYQSCQRLRNLLRDVSLITRIEEGNNQIEKEKVVINDILSDLKEELSVYPPENRLDLKVFMDEKVVVNGNASLLVSIFRNLTENAISYSGGTTITISLLENNSQECKISFEDDGIGVEDKHLSHLFERFYRVDKGRSRQKGGTGLGLAIVKHAVYFHGGDITVSNKKEGGLLFVFSLKKNM